MTIQIDQRCKAQARIRAKSTALLLRNCGATEFISKALLVTAMLLLHDVLTDGSDGQAALGQIPEVISGEMVLQSGSSPDVEQELRSLIQSTEDVRGRLSAQQPTPDNAIIKSIANPFETKSRDQVESDAVFQIRKRIRLLRKLQDTRADTGDTADVEPEQDEPDPSVQRPAISEPVDKKAPDFVQPTLKEIESNLEKQEPASVEQASIAEPVSATRILTSPVNSMKLAESLYRTGNYAAALKALESVDTSQLSDFDVLWSRLLGAICQKRIGSTEDAEAILRNLANVKESDFSVSAGRWWLRQMETTQKTVPAFKQISGDIDSLLERANRHVAEHR